MAPLLQAHPSAFGSMNENPVSLRVSRKSIVTPANNLRLSGDRYKLRPFTDTTSSPANGAGSTLNCDEKPEQPPGETVKRKPALSPRPPHSTRSAAEHDASPLPPAELVTVVSKARRGYHLT